MAWKSQSQIGNHKSQNRKSQSRIKNRKSQIANGPVRASGDVLVRRKSRIANRKSQMVLCVYAVASPPDRRVAVKGVGGERLRAVTVGRITAVIGELPRAPTPIDAALRKYDRVVQALSLRLSALLPARFGTCVQDLAELSFILQSRQETFQHSLQAVRGRAQMTVRVMPGSAAPENESAPAVTGAGPRVAAPGSGGAEYLRSRAAAAAREREVPGFESVRTAVRHWVRDERVERHGSVSSVYHLVPRGQARRYRLAVEHAAHDAGLRVMVSGPWPPYAFSTPF
jgi:hypothetical protein